ncbi:MAG: metalloprotease TldD [Rhodobacteraceae bacterium]|nr:metalloprotease TldD [Paracoccaceae bacterium]
MSQDVFSPFEQTLDKSAALASLQIVTSGADDGELYLERSRSESLVYDDQSLKKASYDATEGFGLRAVNGAITGYAHSTEISEPALKRAEGIVTLATKSGGGILADAPNLANKSLYRPQNPMEDVPFGSKLDLIKEINDFARALDKRVVQVSVSLSAGCKEVVILRPDAALFSDVRPMCSLNVSVIVDDKGRRESGYCGGGGRFDLCRLVQTDAWQAKVREALRIAVLNLDAVPAPAGTMDVVLGPGWPGILLHEAIGHGLEGDFNRKGSSAFAGLMGKKIAASEVTVFDDGTLPERRGSINIDDEGTPSGKNVLVEDGILVGYMQDRQNARLMGVKPTGNGRRQSFAHVPMPRMTNTYMIGGKVAPEDILAGLKDGIYAVGFGGGQVDITNGKFVFSCTEAYRVKGGKIGRPIKGATLIGDGATALKKIRAVGNNMELDPGMGNCGKQGQWVPVGVGQPTLMIGGLTVGGASD